MPTHNDTYLACPTRVSALKACKRHMFCGRNALFLLLPLEDGRAAGVRGRRFTSKGGQRAAHVAASLETWPRVRRAFRSLFARSTRSAYGGCFVRRRSLLYLEKSPQHSIGSFATVLRERECRALSPAPRPHAPSSGAAGPPSRPPVVSERRRSTRSVLLLAGSAGLSKRADFAAPLLPQEPRSLANALAMAATWTYLTRPAPQLGEWRGFE